MSYTYVISKNPTGDDFKTLCKRIDEMYSDYERAGGRKYADGAENVRWEKGQLAITAELEAAPAVLTVCSDEALPALEREYRLLGKEQKKRNIKDTHRYSGRSLRDFFFGSYTRVKFVFLPILFAVIGLVPLFAAGVWGFLAIFLIIPAFVQSVLYLLADYAVVLGWVWLIPAGAAAMLTAERKSSTGVKLIVTALPVIGVAYGCRWYGIYKILDYVDINIELVFVMLMCVPLIYLAALPYMIIDEVACRRLKTVTGTRPRARTGVICWIISFILSAGVLAASCYPEYHAQRLADEMYDRQQYADSIYRDARTELVYNRYGDEILDIAKYAMENGCYNWTECPERTLEGQWRRVFLEAGADYEIGAYEGYVIIRFPGTDYMVQGIYSGGEEEQA